MAAGCVCVSGNRGCRRGSADPSDDTAAAFVLFLLCQRIGTVSQMVLRHKAVPEASGQLCEGTGHDAEDEALYSASGVGAAASGISDDGESSGKNLHCVPDYFQVRVLLYKNQNDSCRIKP